MNLTTLFISILLSTVVIVLLACIPFFRSKKEEPPPVVEPVIPEELNVNFLTASFECSHHGKEWHICVQPDGWGSMFYCPVYSDYNESELALVEWGKIGVPTPISPCFTCPGIDSNCSSVVDQVLTAAGIAPGQNATLWQRGIWDEAVDYCVELCERNEEGESCNQDDQCTPGELFCDYDADDNEYVHGTCKPCPVDTNDCNMDGFTATKKGWSNCRDCSLECYSVGASRLWIDGKALSSQHIDSAIQSSHQTASGPLHDCSSLATDAGNICLGAKGKICLIYFENQSALRWQVSNMAEKSGCVGLIGFLDKNYEAPVSHSDSILLIPYIYVTNEVGVNLLKNKIGVNATVEVSVYGTGCYPSWETDNKCSVRASCHEGEFCYLTFAPAQDGSYTQGYCEQCPKDHNGELNPIACFFNNDEDLLNDTVQLTSIRTVQKVQECAASCGAQLTSKGCKFCATQLTEFEFIVNNQDERCLLCPKYDVQHPDRVVSLFGETVTCRQLDSFFKRAPVSKYSPNCQLAQSFNFICGCEGQGYAGASTQTKKAVLAWLPRMTAFLSILGSLFIIFDTQRTSKKRAKVINKILCSISVFDTIGSLAMSFTTLPTPEDDYMYGSRGTDATCTAQGFFIQMGTVACLLGVSLAVYYNLAINHNWGEKKMKSKHILHFLLIPPIAIGLAFAGAGIPHYDNVMVWCNNSAKWWPEIPIVVSIFCATFIMGDVTFSVYKRERATSRYTGGSNKLSRMVVKQASLFVASFFVTWVPYLVLQYLLSSGSGFDVYGLTLAASTMATLQGFWNFIVYARPRYFNAEGLSLLRSSLSAVVMRYSRSIRTKRDKPNQETQATQPASNKPSSNEDSNVAKSATESEVIQFGAPDPLTNHNASTTSALFGKDSNLETESEIVPFGARNPDDEWEDSPPGFLHTIDESDVVPPCADDSGVASESDIVNKLRGSVLRISRQSIGMKSSNASKNAKRTNQARLNMLHESSEDCNEDHVSPDEDGDKYDMLLAG